MKAAQIPNGHIWDNAYVIEKLIGEGGMAYVYKAKVCLDRFNFPQLISYWEAQKNDIPIENQSTYRKYRKELWQSQTKEEAILYCQKNNICYPEKSHCAIKILSTDLDNERFLTEWQKTIGLYNPHLLQIYGGGRFQDLWYYSMEFVESNLDISNIYKLSLPEKVGITLQAARGLQSLHERSVIHRDVKLDNLIVFYNNEDLHVKIGDLGVAKNLELDHTKTSQVLGTPNFMSPEQVKSSKNVDIRTDIYSLGATLYEMVAKQPPYHGESLQTILRNLNLGVPPNSLESEAPDTPKNLVKLVEQLMSFDLKERPKTMEEVQKLLQDYLAGKYKSTSSVRRKKTTRQIKPVKKKRRRTEAFKMTPEEEEKKVKKEMYAKLFVLLLGPIILILYILFAPEQKAPKKNGKYQGLDLTPPEKKQPEKQPETAKNRFGEPLIHEYEDWKQNGYGKWFLENRIWEGHCERAYNVLVLKKYPEMKDYVIKFYLKVESGLFSLGLRGLHDNAKEHQSTIFRHIVAKFQQKHRIKYPSVTKWYEVEAFVERNQLTVTIKEKSSMFQKGKEKAPLTLSRSINDQKKSPGEIGFLIESHKGFPAYVEIKDIEIKEILPE